MATPKLSIVSPVYKADGIIEKLIDEIHQQVAKITVNYEIILVEDHSPDHSWSIIEKICKRDKKVIGIKLSRNFGQHYAITAGLEQANGEWVVVMDCDLQDRPQEIPNLFEYAINNNYQLVFARRAIRQDNWLKRLSSKIFYKVFSYLTDTDQDPAIANFGIYSRKVTQAILSMQDHIRYFPTMSQWVGFRKGYLDVEHSRREEGKSSYTLWKLIQLAVDNMIAFSDKPLWLAIRLGFFIACIAALIGGYYIIQYFRGEIIVLGYASLMISIWFLSGITILVLGVVGVYVGKSFEKVKGRPLYIIEKTLNNLN
jgi:dolichol-phosphate mannosyltransferase